VPGDPPLVGSPVDFGPALVGGNPRSAILTLSWHDTGSIAVTALSSSNAEFRVAAGQQFPIALSASSPTATITMEFLPTSLGARTGSLMATVNPATCAVPPIALQGNGAPPGLAANPVGADFDQVDIGTTSPPKTFRIINLSGADAALPSDGSYSFTVVAQPQTGGQHDADVIIVSNSSTTPMLTTTIHVEGTCAGAPCEVEPGPGSGSDSGNGLGRDRASYYACSAGHAFAIWPVLLALVLLRRRPRRAR
jgi:hypothetical protein